MTAETGIREDIKLSWDDVVEQFENLVKFAAKQQIDNNSYGTDSMITAEDLFQEGMIKLYDCWVIWCVDRNKGMDEFGPIFRTSLFRLMKNKGRKKGSVPTFIDIEDTENSIKDEGADDTVERLYQEAGILKLRELLTTDIAKRVLDELADPSPNTLYQVWADTKRREMIKSQGRKVNIPKDNTVRMKHIIRSLQITEKQCDVAMVEIRQMARLALKE